MSMLRIVCLLVALFLLGLAGFCVFGFLASSEPGVRDVVAWRAGYAAAGVAAIIGAALLVWWRGGSLER